MFQEHEQIPYWRYWKVGRSCPSFRRVLSEVIGEVHSARDKEETPYLQSPNKEIRYKQLFVGVRVRTTVSTSLQKKIFFEKSHWLVRFKAFPQLYNKTQITENEEDSYIHYKR